eukprot:CAMPEP_0185262250 /NCGR_PEP_ID=MMETSP1359-20130426/10452_1 /TAXON_ID=552665 /ORGANISM="Bigelowiella longifila, Strain CCMP242" /LENGTH=70 /DNA_ID=CAMNT_0027849137 /DNA_START=160 /DNA_END=373 /DNA_ORIENTATION=-
MLFHHSAIAHALQYFRGFLQGEGDMRVRVKIDDHGDMLASWRGAARWEEEEEEEEEEEAVDAGVLPKKSM